MIEEHETKQEEYGQDVPSEHCHHPRLVCKDCGAVIMAMTKAG